MYKYDANVLFYVHVDWVAEVSGHSSGRSHGSWTQWRAEETTRGRPPAAQVTQCHLSG